MKLNEYLNTLGLTVDQVTTISNEIDVIKTKAVKSGELKLKEAYEKIGTVEKQLQEYDAEKSDVSLEQAYIKAGGDTDKFGSFKKVTGQFEKIEDVNFEETFKEFPGLLGTQAKENDMNYGQSSSNLANITAGDDKDVEPEFNGIPIV